MAADIDPTWLHTAAVTTTRSTFKIEDTSLGPGRVDFDDMGSASVASRMNGKLRAAQVVASARRMAWMGKRELYTLYWRRNNIVFVGTKSSNVESLNCLAG